MKFSFNKTYKSISPFEWNNIAPLSILTGLNGVGKSQLLEIIASEYNSIYHNNRNNQQLPSSFIDHKFKFKKYTNGANSFGHLSLGHQNVSHSDLKLIINTIYKEKHPEKPQSTYNPSFTQDDEKELTRLMAAKNSNNRFYHLAKSKANKIFSFLSLYLKKEESHITPFDIAINLPEHILFEDYSGTNGENLEFTFFLYEYKRLARKKQGLENADTIPPWEILNEAIEASSLPYKVSFPDGKLIASIFDNPLNDSLEVQFKINIQHTIKGYQLQFGDLSSGERILMSLAMQLYYAKERGIEHDVLLLDEPDAHLHPSMTQQFFRVIYDVLVRRHGVNVIMTTHSPSTVALAPLNVDCVVYELKKDPTTITPVTSREDIIRSLTEGIVIVMPATRTVLIEGKDDKPFYEALYVTLLNQKKLTGKATLTFVTGTGVSSVHHWSKGLRDAGLSETIRGIIDKDNNNTVSDGILRLERYSIENYIIEPVAVMVTGRAIPGSIVRHGLFPGDEYKFHDLTQEHVQEITNSVLNYIEPNIPKLQIAEKSTVSIVFTNGFSIDYPLWFIQRRGKDLYGIFNEHFGKNLTREALTASLKRLQFIPKDILDIFNKIQE